MSEHLQYEDEKVSDKSDAGKFTMKLLHLNDPDSQQFKQNLILSSKSISKSIKSLKEQKKGLVNLLKQNLSKKEKEDMLKEIMEIDSEINDYKKYYDSLSINMN